MAESGSNQVSVVAFTPDLYDPKAANEKPSKKDDTDHYKPNNVEKKYINGYLEIKSS